MNGVGILDFFLFGMAHHGRDKWQARALLHRGDGDVREVVHVVEHSQGVEAPLGFDFQVHLQKLTLCGVAVFQFMGMHLHPVRLDALDELLDRAARRGGKAQFHGDVSQLGYEEVQHLQSHQDHRSGDHRGYIHARVTG